MWSVVSGQWSVFSCQWCQTSDLRPSTCSLYVVCETRLLCWPYSSTVEYKVVVCLSNSTSPLWCNVHCSTIPVPTTLMHTVYGKDFVCTTYYETITCTRYTLYYNTRESRIHRIPRSRSGRSYTATIVNVVKRYISGSHDSTCFSKEYASARSLLLQKVG